MRRKRSTESVAVGHTTPPLIVEQMDPIADHPALGPMRDRRSKRVAAKAGKRQTKVKVEVDVKEGSPA